MINPIKVFETPNDLAKIGIAGIISPKPTATRKDIEVNTATSLGRSLKGELNLIFNQAFLAMSNLAIGSEDYYYWQVKAVIAENLIKTYDKGKIRALDGLSLDVEEGTVLGVLGPNGAGKTTTVRILATLLTPDSGRASVAGIDVIKHPGKVREVIGLSGQYAAVDETLTGWDNLTMFSRLYHLSPSASKKRAGELLEQFSLTDAAKRPIKTYSGGMRRRLDLAASLIVKPKILFLDEPTTGLDPQARHILWDRLFRLKELGVTLVITTHFMDEAEQLCDRLVVMDKGKIMAEGSPLELIKTYSTKEVLEVRFGSDRNKEIAPTLRAMCSRMEELPDRILMYVEDGEALLEEILNKKLHPTTSLVRRSSLEDVFLRLTGRTLIE